MTATTIENLETNIMQTAISKSALWTGRILSTAATLFCVMDGGMKLAKPQFVVDATLQLGYPESTIVGIGAAMLVSTLLYVIPRTSVLGALFITAYLGGAVASNIRAQTPLFNIAFPVIVAIFVWGGLWLRDQRVRELLPISTN